MAGTKFSGFSTGATTANTLIVGYDSNLSTNNQYTLAQLAAGIAPSLGIDTIFTTTPSSTIPAGNVIKTTDYVELAHPSHGKGEIRLKPAGTPASHTTSYAQILDGEGDAIISRYDTNTVQPYTLIGKLAGGANPTNHVFINGKDNGYGAPSTSGYDSACTIIGGNATYNTYGLRIQGSGDTNATSVLLVEDDAGTDILEVKDDGNVGIGGASKVALSAVYDYDTVVFETQLANNEGGGEIMKYGSGQAGAIGTLHFLHTDGSWDQADADAVATGASQLLGIPMGTDPGDDGMLIQGFYRVEQANIDGTPAIGAPVYVSEAIGEFDFTAPSATGDFVRIVGYCVDIHSDDILLHFNPDKTWIELA